MTAEFSPIEQILEEIRRGQMVIMVDDEDRENEGDLIMAASSTRAEHVNFMAQYGRGLICLTLTEDDCHQLNLPLMAQNTRLPRRTNFTVSIDACHGITTGISASDRACTIAAAVAQNAKADDLVQPGHVFPLMAKKGGVLARAGHTEAGCDLARLAGLAPSAVIVEILNEDGSMARRADLEKFARQHQLKIGTIADLIRFRMQREMTVHRKLKTTIATRHGEFSLFVYEDRLLGGLHYALVKGVITDDLPPLVRVHVENPLSDLLGIIDKNSGWPLNNAIERVAREQSGIIVILCNQLRDDDLVDYLKGRDQFTVKPGNTSEDLHTIGLGGQILSELGARKIRVLSPLKKLHAISGFNLEIVEYISDAS